MRGKVLSNINQSTTFRDKPNFIVLEELQVLNLGKRNYKLFYSNLRRSDKRGDHVSKKVLCRRYKPILAIEKKQQKSIMLKSKYTN